MFRSIILIFLSALLLFSFQTAQSAAPVKELTGQQVAEISRTFLRNHYSRQAFDDEHSRKMFNNYINRFDPGHYYFLQSDFAKYQQYSNQLDNMLLEGNIDIAFQIFDTFKMRIKEREALIKVILKRKNDLRKDDSLFLDRKNEPFPRDNAEAEKLWTKKLKFELLELVLSGSTEEEGKENLLRRYRTTRKQIDSYTRADVITAFLNAFTATFDPHSTYLSPDDLENFNISLRLSLEGIGATLRWEDGLTVVTSIIAGGAAWREGSLKPDDRIIEVAQGKNGSFQDVRNLRLIEVVKQIRGKRGTIVRLKLFRKTEGLVEKRLQIAITRDKIVLKEGEAKGRIIEREIQQSKKEKYRIGVIKLPSFYVDFSKRNSDPKNYKSSSRDVEKILVDFKNKNVNGIILDLRNNGGGGLQEAVSLSGLFLGKGPVVMVKTVRGRIETYANNHAKPVYKGPLMILTNRYSASASEILAGALKDYGRAILVGESSTFGKGTVQNIHTLPKGLGALKITVAKFYRPGSSSTQHKGVVPDIVLPSLNNHLEIGESTQDNALPWDTIRKSQFKSWGNLSPVIPILEQKSKVRRKINPKFQEVESRVREYLAERENKKIVTIKRMIEQSKKNNQTKKVVSPPPDQTHKNVAEGDPDEDDFYLNEGIDILVDYLGLGGGVTHLAGRKS